MKENILDQLNLYIWAKDKNYRYLYCNEHYAMAVGLDSPGQIVGKSDDIKDILVSENQLLDNGGSCVGIVGSYIDITGRHLVKKTGYYDQEIRRYYLGKENFDNAWFYPREIDVFKRLLLGYTAQQTAELLNISIKTVEAYIDSIKLILIIYSDWDCPCQPEVLPIHGFLTGWLINYSCRCCINLSYHVH